jgi:hypothetical protein
MQPVSPPIAAVAEPANQAFGGESLEDLSCRRSIQRNALGQRFLVDVLFGAKRVEHGKLRRGGLGRHFGVPEPLVYLLDAPNEVAGMTAQVFMGS